MSGGEFRPQFHPASFDAELRPALDDVRAGRWRSMSDLLGRTRTWELWTTRSQVLAAAAAASDAVEAWGHDAPDHNSLMMWARVAVQRALIAHRDQRPGAWALTERARNACEAAARSWPESPVPWVALLALAQTDVAAVERRSPEHSRPAPEALLPYGPWRLLDAADRRHKYNREAWHRMLQALTAYQESTRDFIRWVSDWAPQGSALAVLPLYGHAEEYHEQRERNKFTPLFWTSDPRSQHTRRALKWWFPYADRTSWSPLDLNHLAQALSSGGFAEGADVFEAIGPCATPVPWKYVANSEGWQERFLLARRRYLPDRAAGPLHAGPRR